VIVSNSLGSVTSLVAELAVNLITADSWDPAAGNEVDTVVVQTDGKIIIGGNSGTFAGTSFIGRFNADGSLDNAFAPQTDSTVDALAIQPDGRILVGGWFTMLNNQTNNLIGRLNLDGSADTNFTSGPAAGSPFPEIYAVVSQPDGRIVVGGQFTTLVGQTCYYLGRLNTNGTLDPAFGPGANGDVNALALQSDGGILAGGAFTTMAGHLRSYLARFNADGTFDTNFNPSLNGAVYSLVVQPDAKILVGGWFTTVGGQARNFIGRLNPDGALDTSFNPGPGTGNGIYSLALQTDGSIIADGWFTGLGGQARNYLARLYSDGTLDPIFNPGADNYVYCLAVQTNGSILAGGGFSLLAGQSKNYFGRLANSDPATQSLTWDGARLTWLRAGACPEVSRTWFDFSTNGANWTSLGSGARISGGWQLAAPSVPNSTVRARGAVASGGGRFGSSSWFVESTVVVTQVPPVIVVNDANFGMRSNHFSLNTRALSGQVVIIEASTNLTAWVPIQTNVVNPTGLFLFTDPDSPKFRNRFYRARLFTGALPPPTLLSSGPSFGFRSGAFGFNLSAISGQTIVVEASTNLQNWTALSTNIISTAPFYFADSSSTNFPWRFYRARAR
jgi:uncharacterized delta-60 repeat protein